MARRAVSPPLAGRSRRAHVLAAVTPRTRLALLDHVTSPTGARLSDRGARARARRARHRHAGGRGARARDAASRRHGLGAAYYTGNCHKWLCAPKGAGFLHVRRDRRRRDPAARGEPRRQRRTRTGRSRFRLEFDWTGTDDPTPWLCVPGGDSHRRRAPAGWLAAGDGAEPRARAAGARACLAAALEIPRPAPTR